ncbi:MAG: hypothetical protein M3347_05445, partial [Armatimonadota bacterium]|nr:hypothetical protein [Armatimonadota bacterium]
MQRTPRARQQKVSWLLVAAILCHGVVSVAVADGAATVEPYKWYAFSSGNMKQEKSDEKGPGGTEVRRLTFNATEKLPGDYWVGAGVELATPQDHNVIKFYIRKTSPQRSTVTMKVLDSRGRQGFYELGVPSDWIKVKLRREQPVHTGGGEVPRDIAKIEFILNNTWFKPGEVWTVDVAGIKTSKVTPLAFQNRFWMPAKVPPPVPGYRVEVAIHNIWPQGSTFPGIHNPAGMAMAKDITENFIKEYGPVGIEIGYLSGESGQSFAQFLHERGALSAVTAHNHAAFEQQEDGRSLTAEEKDALHARNAAGQNPIERGLDPTHSEDITNPRFLKLAQQLYLSSAKAGADVYRPVDYVWSYVQGGQSWTYSSAALKAWPQDLNETDAGLELGKGIDARKPVSRRVAHFWEYFASYHGYRMRPSDLGLNSWDEYRPPAPNAPDSPQLRNNRIVLNMLYHYEWLKFANEVTRPSATQYGMLTQPVVNPEEINNGTDLYWLSKLAFARGYWTEWWGHPGIVVPTYYNGRYYDNAVRTNGKEIVIGGEVAAAGGNPYEGRPHYWDNMAGYLVAYSQAGSVDARAQNHQYWAWTWERAIDPQRPEYAAYTGMRSSYCGFLQNRNDKAVKPKTDLLAMSMRAITHGLPYFDHGSDQPYNLGQELVKLNYLHDGAAFPLNDAFNPDDYKTIVFSSFEPPQGFVKKLGQWLSAKAGRTLITHSFVPTRFSAPVTELRADMMAFIQPGGQEKLLGFGSISESDVTSGVLQARHPVFKTVLKEWDGKPVTFSRGICRTAGVTDEKVLLALNDLPLVSEHRAGQGRVIYLHFFANEGGLERGKLQQAIMDAVLCY